MNRSRIALIAGCSVMAGLALFYGGAGSRPAPMPQERLSQGYASYHIALPTTPLPKTASPEEFAPDETTMACYRVAESIREILYQLPCMCNCDKMLGHSSLLDCFIGRHGHRCEICQKEVAFAYDQHRRGASIEQIREQVRAGVFRDADVAAICLQFKPANKDRGR